MCFFALGTALYALVPLTGKLGSVALFAACFCIILSMYGGGFATIPAYLADVFGTKYVSAVHGRLLTAWSVAGVLGPGARELHPRSSRSSTASRRTRPTTSRCTSWPCCW